MKKFLMTVAVAGLAFGTLAACEEKKPEIKKAADGAKSAVNEAGAKANEAAKEVTKEAPKEAPKPAH